MAEAQEFATVNAVKKARAFRSPSIYP